jgi:hypothetical protein
VGRELFVGDAVGYGTILVVIDTEELVDISHGSDDGRTDTVEPDAYGGVIIAGVAIDVSNLGSNGSCTLLTYYY